MRNRRTRFHRTAAYCTAAVLALLSLTACRGTPADTELPVETPPAAMETEQTAPVEEPVFESYPFTFTIDDGSEITVSLPLDPDYFAELHLCTLSGDETPAHVLLHTVAHGTGLLLEEARVFSGSDGTEYTVTPVNEIMSRYVTFSNEDTHWRMLVGGAEYQIPKAQFSDYPADDIHEFPDPAYMQNFFVEHGQLYCRVSFLCAGDGTGFAAETLKIRYDIVDGTVTAAEITFERPETDDLEETEETP